MILNPFSRDTAPFAEVTAAFHSTLATEHGEPIDFHEVPLDLTRFAKSGEQSLLAFLEERLAEYPVDLVVPLGTAGGRFAANHRERLFPKTPILLTGVEPRMIPPGMIGKNVTLVTQPIDLPGMVGQILTMKPETKRIAVVFGASELEKKWATEFRREFASFADRFEFIWLDGLTLSDILDRSSKLPPDTFIFLGLFIEDGDGIPSTTNQALLRLHKVANAPIFSIFMSEIGSGTVGGSLYRDNEVGQQAAHVATRILRGESPETIPPLILGPCKPVYDWRELHRWNIREANLPTERIVRFREPGFRRTSSSKRISAGRSGSRVSIQISWKSINRLV